MIKTSACFLVLLLISAACLDEPDCFNLNNYVVGIAFKKIEDSSADTVELTGFGTLEPIKIFSGDTAISRVYLPLNYFEDETIFYFSTDERIQTLRLQYVSQAQFVSENCGEKFVLSQLRVFKHAFDSVRLLRDIPTSSAGTIHIEIYQ